MNRTIRRTVTLLAVAGMACLPVVAVADPQPIVFTNINQTAGGDIFNAGHDNIVGSGDGGTTVPGLGGVAPATERTARIQTRFDEVTLVSHTGDADFPERLPFSWTAVVRYSDNSTADYHGRDSDYLVSLSDNGSSASCTPTAPRGNCEVTYNGPTPVVTMG